MKYILCLLLLATPAFGRGVIIGNPQATNMGNGQWSIQGSLYTQAIITVPANGCYQPAYQTYQYTPVIQATYIPATPAFEPGWEVAVVKALQKQNEYSVYERSIASLQTGGGNLNFSRTTGSTLYMYNAVKDPYGDYSPALAMQQTTRLAETLLSVTDRAVSGSQGIVDRDVAGRADVARILALGLAAANVKGSSTTTITRTMPQADTLTFNSRGGGWAKSAQRCVACHSGPDAEGGFDITTYPSLSLQQASKVLTRLTSADPQNRMPFSGSKGKYSPGEALPPEELIDWLKVIQK